VLTLLEGVRVLDLSRLVPGAYATSKLADLGADVIKVEVPPDGDYMRGMPPVHEGRSVLFEVLNRNKRSIELDPRTDEGRTVLHALVRSADVVLEGGRPGAMASLGADYESLRAIRPDLVYCSLSGYGQTGPYRDLPSHGANLDGAAGAAPLEVRDDGSADFPNIRVFVASQASALHAALSIAAALFRRERTGRGCHLDVAGFDAAVSWQYGNLSCLVNTGEIFPGSAGLGPRYGCYPTADRRWVFLAAMEPKFWRRVCDAAGHPELVDGVDDSQPLDWGADHDAERASIAAMMAERTQAEWVALAIERELPVSPVNQVDDLPDDPHVRARELLVSTPDGEVQMVAFPVKTADEAFEVRRRAPALGEHTGELVEELGCPPSHGRD
jgi:crotonobetainyl-CoA:carnitine CoA-transferase CaiB-like acyl-CoA transferase